MAALLMPPPKVMDQSITPAARVPVIGSHPIRQTPKDIDLISENLDGDDIPVSVVTDANALAASLACYVAARVRI